jgi:hypothetical protein
VQDVEAGADTRLLGRRNPGDEEGILGPNRERATDLGQGARMFSLTCTPIARYALKEERKKKPLNIPEGGMRKNFTGACLVLSVLFCPMGEAAIWYVSAGCRQLGTGLPGKRRSTQFSRE